jgi:amino acid adenylation domain-containing protein
MEDVSGRLAGLSPEKRELLETLLRRKRAQVAASAAIRPRSGDEGPLPLSFSQERLWLTDQFEPDNPAYNIPISLRFGGALDVAALRESLVTVRRRHESLRTRFEVLEGRPVQVIDPPDGFAVPLVDLEGLPPERREEEVLRLAQEDATRPFDLRRGPVFRSVLVRLSGQDHALLSNVHHIVSDGWSTGVFSREVEGLYAALSAGRPAVLPPLPIQYADFALWQRRNLDGAALEAQLDFWRRQLAGLDPVLELPADRPRPPRRTPRGRYRPWSLPVNLSHDLRELSGRAETTVFTVLLAGFLALLHHQTQREDLCVGTPVAGRRQVETEGLIGFFVNTLVLRVDLAGDPSFRQLLARAHQTVLDAQSNQDVPFERLVSELALERSPSYTPIFQVLFALQQVSGTASPLSRALSASSGAAKFDLSLLLTDDGITIGGGLEYSLDLFDPATAERLLDQLHRLLEEVAARPEGRLSEVPLLSPSERHQLLIEWVAVEEPSPGGCLHELFGAQAKRTPDAVALVHGTRSLTYGELAGGAGGIARRLRELGVGPETRVAVCLERSPDLIAALLGVLAAGAAYVPVDPAYPADRQHFMLEDSGAAVLVARGAPAAGPVVLDLDAEEITPAPWPETGVGPNNLAYVIYTSGSTGRPKGVAIEHRSAVVLAHWARSRFSGEELSGVLASTSVCFDVSVFEIFVPLALGGRLILAENALELPSLPATAEVRIATMVPSAAAELVRAGAIPPSVRVVGLGGEPVPGVLAERLYGTGTVERVLNLYGPSEDTTYSTMALVPRDERAPAIGRPLPGTRVYVVGRRGGPVPLGVAGELWLAGAGLSRGYLGRPALTAEKFVPDPFGEPGARAYRTGDLVRYRTNGPNGPDGELEFLGRVDHQVKVRGFRIELGEIEAVLEACPGVRGAAVLVREDTPGSRLLAGYVAGEAGVEDGLRAWLGSRLPEYMVPSLFVRLDALPLTPNGKVDRRALAGIVPERPAAGEGDDAPRTPTEEVVAVIWAQVLGLERVGTGQDFFSLGGHSLLGTQVLSRIRETLGVDLPLSKLFAAPTVARFAREVEAAQWHTTAAELPRITRAPRDEPPPLSFAQERHWLRRRLVAGTAASNVVAAVRMNGPLEVVALARSLREIARRHEILRTIFAEVAGRPVQIVHPDWTLPLRLIDLSGLPAEMRKVEERRACALVGRVLFDLEVGPLAMATLVRVSADDHVFHLVIHHGIYDGWSQGVFFREMGVLYRDFRAGKVSSLPEPPLQYGDYAWWQRNRLEGEPLNAQREYWRGQLAGDLRVLRLPADHPEATGFEGATEAVVLPSELTAELRALAQREGATLFMVLLAGFKIFLHLMTGERDLALTTVIANRNRVEIEGLLGLFSNVLILRTDLSGDPGFLEVVRRVRATTLGAYAHQDLPFTELLQTLSADRGRELGHNDLFPLGFVLQNAPAATAAESGELSLRFEEAGTGTANRDFILVVSERPRDLVAAARYRTGAFERETVARFLRLYRRLLADLVADPARPLSGRRLDGEAHPPY